MINILKMTEINHHRWYKSTVRRCRWRLWVGARRLCSGCKEEAYFHFVWCEQCCLLASHALSFHHENQSLTQQPLHLTSRYNVASVETEEGFKRSRPVAVLLLKTSALWLAFSANSLTFRPSRLPSSLAVGWEGTDNERASRRVRANLPPDRCRTFS